MHVNQLDRRLYGYYGSYGYGYGYGYNSRWSSWGRWVLLGVIIVAALFCLFICMCFARRRRRAGSKPMYGTGWMAPGANNNQTYPMAGNYNNNNQQAGYNQGGYNQQQQYGQYQAPPTYGQPQQQQYTGSTFNPNEGYYGQPQQPQNAYNREAGDVAPPTGPPPAKY